MRSLAGRSKTSSCGEKRVPKRRLSAGENRRYEELRRRMIEAREAAEVSQEQLAERLRRPQSYVSKIEVGNRRLDVIEYLTIARAVGYDPYDLLRELEEKTFKKG